VSQEECAILREGVPYVKIYRYNPKHLCPKFLPTLRSTLIVPHPPNLPDLAHCDFALFPKLKMKLRGRHFETVSDIQRELQAVLDSIKENDFHGASEAWKKMRGLLYSVLKEIADRIE
jgi:hypothetical protein